MRASNLRRYAAVISPIIVALGLWWLLPNRSTPRFKARAIAACGLQTLAIDEAGRLWSTALYNINSPFFALARFYRLDTNQWRAIAAGWESGAGVRVDGTLWAWGDGQRGLWDDTTLALTPSPAQIGTNRNWTDVAAGFDFFAARQADQSLWTFGGDKFGQLGDALDQPKVDTRSGPTASGKPDPVSIEAAGHWPMMGARVFRATALKSDGSLWAWGWNTYGELGDGTHEMRHAPVQIGKTNDWTTVFVANDHTLAIKRDGSLWAWGQNREGQLGDGTKMDRSYPIRVGTETDWLLAAGGRDHTLAIKQDGSLWAWGLNGNGQLGDGTRRTRLRPVRIGWSRNWSAIAAGEHHSVALRRDGTMYIWGQVPWPKEAPWIVPVRRTAAKIGIKIPTRKSGVTHPVPVPAPGVD